MVFYGVVHTPYDWKGLRSTFAYYVYLKNAKASIKYIHCCQYKITGHLGPFFGQNTMYLFQHTFEKVGVDMGCLDENV